MSSLNEEVYHEGQGSEGGPDVTPPLTGGHVSVLVKTGVELRVDWFAATWPGDVDLVQDIATMALGCDPGDWSQLESGAYGYKHGVLGPGGARIWWGAKNREDVHLSMPGLACGAVGQGRMVGLLRAAQYGAAKATRIDLALDDFDRTMTPQAIEECLAGPLAVTHAETYMLVASYGIGGREVREWTDDLPRAARAMGDGALGATVYVGSKQSRQRLRVYDKLLESKGEVNAIRWELQARAEAAETLLLQLVESGPHWGDAAAARFITFLDFRELTTTEIEKRPRCDWYEALMGKVRKVKAYPPKPVRTVPRMAHHVEKQYAPTLAVLWDAIGPHELVDLIQRGRSRWRPEHRALAQQKRIIDPLA